MYGKKLTAQQKQKMSAALKGMKRSPETKARISEAKKRYWAAVQDKTPWNKSIVSRRSVAS